ncbi:MAG: hypothetical protein GX438_09280 [Treponema sp.]|nr:hypothetical protein [Treponema sp.]
MKKAKLTLLSAVIAAGLVALMGCPQPTTSGGGGGGGGTTGETYVGDAVDAYNAANYYVYIESTTGVQDNDSELYAFNNTCSLEDATSTGSGIPEGVTALKVTNTGSGAGWSAGGWTTATAADLSSYNALVFYVLAKSSEFNEQLKVRIGDASANSPEVTVPFTVDGTWKKVQVHLDQFTGINKTAITKPFIFVSADSEFNDIFYIDNIYYTYIDGFTPPAEPAPTAAPTAPTFDGSEISLYSDSTGAGITIAMNWASWSSGAETSVDISGNQVKKLPVSFVGYDLTPAADVSGTTNLYIDVWTNGLTAIKIKLVDFKGDGYQGANGDVEYEYSAPISASGQWVTLSIPITTWTSQ